MMDLSERGGKVMIRQLAYLIFEPTVPANPRCRIYASHRTMALGASHMKALATKLNKSPPAAGLTCAVEGGQDELGEQEKVGGFALTVHRSVLLIGFLAAQSDIESFNRGLGCQHRPRPVGQAGRGAAAK